MQETMRKQQRPDYRATKPERIPEKVCECTFFLEFMSRSEGEPFLFYFSAFLSAFRSLLYRSAGVVRHREGAVVAQKSWRSMLLDRDIAFVKNVCDLEVHGDGITVWSNIPAGFTPEMAVLYPPTIVYKCRAALEKVQAHLATLGLPL